ncbi:MAG: PfkB domain protein [Cryptosporangiaceae bacterium]|nr:PfkB domain protein [Cryptosporangiaceae bacterium]
MTDPPSRDHQRNFVAGARETGGDHGAAPVPGGVELVPGGVELVPGGVAPVPGGVELVPGGVLAVGHLVTDVVVHAAGPQRPGSDTPAAIRLTGGGSAAGTAAWLGWLGVPVTFACRVGDDAPLPR